jgi:hypothetical protein
MSETLHPIKDAAYKLGISVWTLRKKAYEGNVASVTGAFTGAIATEPLEAQIPAELLSRWPATDEHKLPKNLGSTKERRVARVWEVSKQCPRMMSF